MPRFSLTLTSMLTIVVTSGIFVGLVTALQPDLGVKIVFLMFGVLAVLIAKQSWAYGIWIPLFGLTVWSYGFNNVPLVRPLPLVDALVGFAVLFSIPYWWPLRRFRIVRNLLVLLFLLMVVVFFRLIIDIPRFGLLALRDALFAFELWSVFPAIALGMMLGERRLSRILFWLFSLATVWFLLYPWRELIAAKSPVVGLQRPVPLFAFTTAGFVAVPAFFWFMYRRGIWEGLGSAAALLVLLFFQSRGSYLAFILGGIVLLFVHGKQIIKRWWKVGGAGIIVVIVLSLVGDSLTGRVGAPVKVDTVFIQLETLSGTEGPGASTFRHRLKAWPAVVEQVRRESLGPIFGIGLGVDLFQAFTLGPDILVRKPHNDFLEIWARLGIVGFLPWLGFLIVLLRETWEGMRSSPEDAWILVLQISLLITSASQPAMGFAYITIVWVILSGLWVGARLREMESYGLLFRTRISKPLLTTNNRALS